MHTIENKVGFTEDDDPNFFGSGYSVVKGVTNQLMKLTNAFVGNANANNGWS